MQLDDGILKTSKDYWDNEKDGDLSKFESFAEFERKLAIKIASVMVCANCNTSSLKSDGVSGNPEDGTAFRLCSIKCKKCGKGSRTHLAMNANVDEFKTLIELREKMFLKFEMPQSADRNKVQKSIKSFFNQSEEDQSLAILVANEQELGGKCRFLNIEKPLLTGSQDQP